MIMLFPALKPSVNIKRIFLNMWPDLKKPESEQSYEEKRYFEVAKKVLDYPFPKIDKNGDGMLTIDEIMSTWGLS